MTSLYLGLRLGPGGIGREWSRVIAPRLRDAAQREQPFFRTGAGQPSEGGGLTQRRRRGPSPFPARVYFLTNGDCATACLDFADIALHIPGTIHLGTPTSGDGLLVEVRGIGLPSTRASLSVPIKVIRGRARGALEAYAPDIAYAGDWSDAAVRAWVMEVITAPH